MLVFSDFFLVNFLVNVFVVLISSILILLFVFVFTKIKIELVNIRKNFKIVIRLYLFNKIRYLKIELNKKKINDIIRKTKLKRFENNVTSTIGDLYFNRKNIKSFIEDLKIELNCLNLDLKIGTEFILLTSVIITTISTIFPIVLNKFIKVDVSKNRCKYKFTPIYNKNEIHCILHFVISIKLIHIINAIIKMLYKARVLDKKIFTFKRFRKKFRKRQNLTFYVK